MKALYDISVKLTNLMLPLLRFSKGKFGDFVRGQHCSIKHVKEAIALLKRDHESIVWIHCASLGEYNIAKPFIAMLEGKGILVTFFSPTGMNAMRGNNSDSRVRYAYLPIDTPRNAQKFVETVNPEYVMFMANEVWPNYLHQLKKHDIPVFLVNANLHSNSASVKWYGKVLRNALRCFTRIFTVNDESVIRLRHLGIVTGFKTGDPLIDHVLETKRQMTETPEHRRDERPVIIGSVHTDYDLEMVASLIKNHPDERFVIVPHEVDEKTIKTIKNKIQSGRRYSEIYANIEDDDLEKVLYASRIVIVDKIGMLGRIYHYGKMAYIGGGFSSTVHNALEATIAGLPVSFGPEIRKAQLAVNLVDANLATIVMNPTNLESWYSQWDKSSLISFQEKCENYLSEHADATGKILKYITSDIDSNRYVKTKTVSSQKLNVTETLRYHAYMALIHPLSLLPFRMLYVLSDSLRPLMHHVLKYRRKIVRKNLKNAYPQKNDEELAAIEKGFYCQFCDNIVETIKLLNVSESEIQKRIEIVNFEQVNESNRAGRPVVLFLGHYANWEWVMRISDYFNTPGAITGHVYKPLKDRAFDKVMNKVRSRFATRGIPQHYAYRHHLGLSGEGIPYVTGFISDQRSSNGSMHSTTRFLNQETHFTPGAERIGDKTGADYYYVEVEKIKRGYYRFTFKPMRPKVSEYPDNPYSRLYFEMLEQTINNNPSLWLWSHRRWLQ